MLYALYWKEYAMNINVYLEDSLAQSLNRQTKKLGKSRNAIIREAINAWIAHHEHKLWPNSILNFKGIQSMLPFESSRNELTQPKEDPLE